MRRNIQDDFILIIIVLWVLYLKFAIFDPHAAAISNSKNADKRQGNSQFEYNSSFYHYITQFPYVIHYISSVMNQSAIVHNGTIVRSDTTPTNLGFREWGGSYYYPGLRNSNNIVMKRFYEDNAVPFFRVSGNTGKYPSGFVSTDLDYRGQYISLTLANVTKSSGNFQVSFNFGIRGLQNDYHLIFVNGPLHSEGWLGNSYYQKINSYSSRLIDLKALIPEDQVSVKQVTITIQSESMLRSLEFRVDLNRTTENPPIILPGGNSYFVIGNVTTPYNITLKNSRYIFHNLGITRIVELDLSPIKDGDKIESNGWNISRIFESKDYDTNENHWFVKAQRQVAIQELSPPAISNFDIYQSIMNFDSKDWLFLVVVIVPLLLYRFREKVYL